MNPINSTISLALSGIHAAQAKALNATSEIASGNFENVADLTLAKVSQAANIHVLRAALESDKHLIDILV